MVCLLMDSLWHFWVVLWMDGVGRLFELLFDTTPDDMPRFTPLAEGVPADRIERSIHRPRPPYPSPPLPASSLFHGDDEIPPPLPPRDYYVDDGTDYYTESEYGVGKTAQAAYPILLFTRQHLVAVFADAQLAASSNAE
jgi:hypothetical protein